MALTRLQKELQPAPPSAAPLKMEASSRAKQPVAKPGTAASGGAKHAASPALGVLFTLCWMAASAALIFINKQLMVNHGFRFPFALTSLGQLSSAVLGASGLRAGAGVSAGPSQLRALLLPSR